MSNRQWYYYGNKLKTIIEQEKRIHKFDLVEKVGISFSLYDKIKPWFEYKFNEFVRYDKPTKEWVSLKEELENNTE